MPAEVVLQHDLMDEAEMAGPVILRQRRGEREVESKVAVLAGQIPEVVFVEDLLPRSCAVPEADLARGLLGFEQVGEVGAQRSHAGAAADVDHLPLRRLDMEIAEGADGGDDVARLEAEDVAGADAGSAVLAGGGVAMRTLKRSVRSVCWLLARE